MASMSARTMHTLADELGVAPELVAKLVTEQKLRSKDSVREAVKAWNDAEAKDSTPTEEPTPKKKKAGLTLSQRRALLRLLDVDAEGEGISPATAFKSLPFEHLVEVGYAESTVTGEGDDASVTFTLTDEGRERAEQINPGYRDWSAGETVVVDDEGQGAVKDENGNPIRPVHGTHRMTKAEQDAIKAAEKAEAQAAAEKAKIDSEKKDEDADTGETETTKDVVTA